VPHGITQCYLPPGRGDIPALTPAEAGTRLATPEGCKAELKTEMGGSVADWLACWTQAQKARVQIAAATLSGNSLRQTVHTHCASVHQAAKLVAALLRVWATFTFLYRDGHGSFSSQPSLQTQPNLTHRPAHIYSF